MTCALKALGSFIPLVLEVNMKPATTTFLLVSQHADRKQAGGLKSQKPQNVKQQVAGFMRVYTPDTAANFVLLGN